MSLWRQLTRGLRGLAKPSAANQDVADEVQHYTEQAIADLTARGLSLEAARRAVQLEFGNPTIVREQVRVSGWESLVRTFFADLGYAGRQLRNNPGFAATVILILALGIGASTAIFSAVNPILLEPLPYPQASRIMMIWDSGGDRGSRLPVTFGTYRELLARSRSFDELAVMKPWQPTLTGALNPERFEGQQVSAAYFRALGVLPAMGRDFQPADDRPDSPPVVILGRELWQRLGSDNRIVGQPIKLDGKISTVIGVMPSGFENVLAPEAEIWAPLQYDTSLPPDGKEWGHHLGMVGRLRPGVGILQAKRELDTIARTPVADFHRPFYAALDSGLMVNSLQADVTSGVRPALLALIGAVILVLIIACVNVTSLLLARGAQRRSEFAMRAALGAPRTRLLRQLLTESLLLAALGGCLGMVVAKIGVQVLLALSPAQLPRVSAIAVNGAVFAFAVAITTLIGVAVGLIPALHASHSDPHTTLQTGSQRTAGGHQQTRRVLVVAEVAIALVLLVSAGLLLRSLQRLFAIDPGFVGSHLLTLQVQTSGDRMNDNSTRIRFLQQSLDEVRNVPGVSAAAFTSQLPLSGALEDGYGVHFESSPTGKPDADNGADGYAVSPGYFGTMSIPLHRGRLLDEHDTASAPLVAVISESLARSKFPGHDPIGQRLRIGPAGEPWHTVVGVVGNVKQVSLALSQSDAVYVSSAQSHVFGDRAPWLVVRAHADAAALTPAIKNALWTVDKDQPIVRVATLDDLLAASAAERHFALVLFAAFALTALALTAIGIYGVLAGSVAERMREIGVRAALGASRANILALVLRQGMTLTALGVVIGLMASFAATQAIATLLFGISRLDLVTYIGVIALLLGVASVACWVPAWRASQVDPSITLRSE